MSTKDNILYILEKNRNTYTSGEALASELSISRTAIWKAIKVLRNDGYNITAVTNRGYQLDSACDLLSAQGIQAFLSPCNSACDVVVYQTIDSTNLQAKRLLLGEEKYPNIIIAEEQTAGRSHSGTAYFSPPFVGIYMSVILKPVISLDSSQAVSKFAAVAVCMAIEELLSLKPCIVSINDIYVEGKKICGILTEVMGDLESGKVENIIVGIGINFDKENYLSAKNVQRNQLAAKIVQNLILFQDIEFEHEYASRH